VLSNYAVNPDKIHVSYNGVEWQELQEDFNQWPLEQPLLRKELGIAPHAFQYLFVGSGFQRKGLGVLLEALATFKNEHFELSVVGKDKKTKAFAAQAAKLGLANKVKFFGPRKDTVNFYKACDALAIPSFYDPFANVTVEALAMGLRVVSSKENGGHEILTPDNGSVIEDLSNPAAVAASLKSVMGAPKSWHHSLEVRNSIKNLEFKDQLKNLVEATLRSC
ncbi:MAG: glycosyltransferase family 4 protein, partial [Chlamydiota bacterium]